MNVGVYIYFFPVFLGSDVSEIRSQIGRLRRPITKSNFFATSNLAKSDVPDGFIHDNLNPCRICNQTSETSDLAKQG